MKVATKDFGELEFRDCGDGIFETKIAEGGKPVQVEFGVAMFHEHDTEELPAEVLVELFGKSDPTASEMLDKLHPQRLEIEPTSDDDRYTLDYRLGDQVSDNLVCVRLDDDLQATEVVVES